MKKVATAFTLFSLVSALVAHVGGQIPADLIVYPDLIIYNGKIVTVDDQTTPPTRGRSWKHWP